MGTYEIPKRHLKILLVGNGGVGKTTFLRKVDDISYQPERYKRTMTVNFVEKDIMVDSCRCRVELWDTAGQAAYDKITSQYYKNANTIGVVFDPSNITSFEDITNWVEKVRKRARDVPVVLIASKSDISESKVSIEKLDSTALELGCELLSLSAYDKVRVRSVFNSLVQVALAMPDTDTLTNRKSKKRCLFQ